MKLIERVLGYATITFAIALFFLPARITVVTGCGLLFATGLWGVLYPQGLLGWAKTAHPEIDPEDDSVWWVPRIICGGFMLFAVVSILGILGFNIFGILHEVVHFVRRASF